MIKKHICKPLRYCVCSVLSDDPDEDCPIHGIGLQNRCSCGRFVEVINLNETVDWLDLQSKTGRIL